MWLFQTIFMQLTAVTFQALCKMAVLAVVFTLLAMLISACNKVPPWWRKPDLSTDICWAVVPQLLYRFAQALLLILGISAFYGIHDSREFARFFTDGYGPLAHLGFWPQVILYLFGSDFVMYATHRLFHSAHLWRFHAVHHSSEHLEWISAARFHPVDQILHGILADVVMLLLGIPPEVLAWLMPFNVGTSALVHSNLNWDFGPLRFFLVSPIYHRWHHTSPGHGGSSNFAGTFPLFDMVFGTFYMPSGQRPSAYGLDDPAFPTHFVGQILYPFTHGRKAKALGVRP